MHWTCLVHILQVWPPQTPHAPCCAGGHEPQRNPRLAPHRHLNLKQEQLHHCSPCSHRKCSHLLAWTHTHTVKLCNILYRMTATILSRFIVSTYWLRWQKIPCNRFWFFHCWCTVLSDRWSRRNTVSLTFEDVCPLLLCLACKDGCIFPLRLLLMHTIHMYSGEEGHNKYA